MSHLQINMDGYDDFSEASEQEHFELDANDADAPVVASDSKQEGQTKTAVASGFE
jgi:hypothetical protein